MPAEARVRGASGWRWLSPFGFIVVIVFAVRPVVGFAQDNHTQSVDLGALALIAFVAADLAVAVALLGAQTRLDRDRWAVAVAAGLLSFSSASLWLSTVYPNRWVRLGSLVAWTVVTAGLMVLAYRVSRPNWVRTFVLLFGVIYLVIPLVSYTSYRRWADGGEHPVPEAVLAPVTDVPTRRPNVYWLMLDEYGRRDQVERYTGVDVGAFYGDLAARGFDVSGSSSAAYNRTQLSLASTLTMQYLFQPGNQIRNEFDVAGPIVIGHNPVVDRFKALGYRYLYTDAGSLGWAHCQSPPADRCITADTGVLALDDLQMNLLRSTALATLPLVQESYADPVTVVDRLYSEVDPDGPPFFWFAHILSPHWPYRLGPDCSRRPTPMEAQLLVPRERAAAYGSEITCLNPEILTAVDHIIGADPTAVIIVQADHGTAFSVDWSWSPEQWTEAAVQERFAPLNAIRFPSECPHPSLDGQPLVNTYRMVFACLEGEPPVLLEPRAFVSSFDRVDDLIEVEPSRPAPTP